MRSCGLIAFCGLDGSGKSTQLQMLAEWLREQGQAIVITRQPTDFYRQNPYKKQYFETGKTDLGMEGLALLAAADRQLHLNTEVFPHLAQSKIVLTDRYVYSTYAFFMARGLAVDFLRAINPKVPKPALTVFLDVPVDECHRRIQQRDSSFSSLEESSLTFLSAVRTAYLEVVDESFLILEGVQPPDMLHAQIRKVVASRMTVSGVIR